MLPDSYETFLQDDAEQFLVAIDKANSKEVTNNFSHIENEYNPYKKNSYSGEPIKSKIYNAFIKVPELLQWAVLLLGPDVPFTCTVRNFIDDLCNDVECMIIRDKGVDIHWSSLEDGVASLPFLLTAITKQINHQAEVNNLYSESVDKPQLILCVIPNEGGEKYIEEIQRICKKIKIVAVFIKCSEIANSTPEFRSSLGEEMKDKLIQFLIEQSQEQNKRKSDDDYLKQNKTSNSNKFYGNNSNNYNNDQDYKNGNMSFSDAYSPKFHSSTINSSYDNSMNNPSRNNLISPLNMSNSMSRSYQYNSPGRAERDRYFYSNHDDNSLSPGWGASKPIYFSKSSNSSSQYNASYSSRNNGYSVSPSPHSSISRRERDGTFSSLRNYSYFNTPYYINNTGSSPINMDKKSHYNNDDGNYSISNNSEVMFSAENDGTNNNLQNKHSRSNTICNGVISNQKDVVNTPRKYSAANYTKSYNNNSSNYYNYNSKLGIRNKFGNNKRLSTSYSIGNHDKNNEYHYQYQYTNSYLEGLNLERNYRNNSYWEGKSYNNSYNNKFYTPMEYHSYSYHDNKYKNNKYYNKKNNQDSSSSGSSPKSTTDMKSNKYDRKYDADGENNNQNEDDISNKMDNLKISKSFDKEKNEVPKYRPPIPPYNEKIENDDTKLFTNNNFYASRKNDENLSRSLPTKNFFNDVRSNRKSNEINDWNKSNNNKSNYKFGKFNNVNSYKSKLNNSIEDNDLNDKNDSTSFINSSNSSPGLLTIDIKNLKYRAPTPKNLMEGKFKSISPDSYYKNYNSDNDSTRNNYAKKSELNNDTNDNEVRINHSPKKEMKTTVNESITNSKIIQSPTPIKIPSVEKYIPPNLRNKYNNGSNNNSNSNSKRNSFDKSSNMYPTTDNKINRNSTNTPNNNGQTIIIQNELSKEIYAQHDLSRTNTPLLTINSPNNNNNNNFNSDNKIIENNTNSITNNNSLLFNSRRYKMNPRTNLNNNYNQVNEDYIGNNYTNPNSINTYYNNSVNPPSYDSSPNISDNNSDSLANYYRTYK